MPNKNNDDTGLDKIVQALRKEGFDKFTAVFIAYGARHAVDNEDFISQYGTFGNEILTEFFFPID